MYLGGGGGGEGNFWMLFFQTLLISLIFIFSEKILLYSNMIQKKIKWVFETGQKKF